MKKMLIAGLSVAALFSGVAMAEDDKTGQLQEEISAEEAAKVDAQAEIEQLKSQLDKVNEKVSAQEAKVQELQGKLDAASAQ